MQPNILIMHHLPPRMLISSFIPVVIQHVWDRHHPLVASEGEERVDVEREGEIADFG
jgi:hypothetical protein